ncbi:hypothetical protein [Arthrobacter sp. ISL-72]|uniref:hypothetical protein n=1 Tax=Arthrobacter sp. ISL-72 TaxID=2819114 RepID=UPI001BEC1CBA|nr:hypothetical protein [Arthrobacter sp. ISL-72]MBT2594672.1 hypothetical protein [Arthrobacter sp. ISL-72]
MSFLRWAPTFLGFPVGGWLAFQVAGLITGPLTAALAGVIAGAVIGGAQWLALGPAAGWRWLAGAVLGMGAGSALAAVVTGAGTTTPALVMSGLLTGAVIGAAQGVALQRGLRVRALWAATVSLSWGLGWLVTANVIVDAENGYAAFGSSGALVATALTGLVLRRILGPDVRRPAAGTPSAAPASAKPVQ